MRMIITLPELLFQIDGYKAGRAFKEVRDLLKSFILSLNYNF